MMKKALKNLILLAVVITGLILVSCREIEEDEAAPPMQNEMHQEGKVTLEEYSKEQKDSANSKDTKPKGFH